MTELNPAVLEEQAKAKMDAMKASLAEYEIRDASLAETVVWSVQESAALKEGKLGVAFVYNGTDAEWEREREHALRAFSCNSISDLLVELADEKSTFAIRRAAPDRLLHDTLAEVGADLKAAGATRVVLCLGSAHYAAMQRPKFVKMSTLHLDTRFDFAFGPQPEGRFRLSLLSDLLEGQEPVEATYALVPALPASTIENASYFWIELEDGKIFEVTDCKMGRRQAWDLLYLFLRAEGLQTKGVGKSIELHEYDDGQYSILRLQLLTARGIEDEPDFLSAHFRNLSKIPRRGQTLAVLAAEETPFLPKD
jgi:hypothetical protein